MDCREMRRACRCVCGREITCEIVAAATRRESLWSVSPAWRNVFFSLLGVSLLATSCVIIAYTLINVGDAGIMETYMLAASRILISGGAQAILIYSVTDSWEAMMVLANYLRQNLLEPLKERQRREGVEEGLATANARWRAWNERREKAAELGEPFDEPPPYFDA